MKSDFQLNVSPTHADLNEIEKWLIEEDKTFEEGFYCNWTIIEKAFRNHELIIFNLDGLPIGFLVWSNREIYANIDLFEIKPAHRNNGIGKYFFDQVTGLLKEKGFLALKLFCSPRESERFWRKMGFIQFPDRGFAESDLTFYKPLIETLKTTNACPSDSKLELWNVEPHQVKNHDPKWIWKIESTFPPIFQPCSYDWNLKWTKNGETLREGKVKNFFKTQRLDHIPFLIITELNE